MHCRIAIAVLLFSFCSTSLYAETLQKDHKPHHSSRKHKVHKSTKSGKSQKTKGASTKDSATRQPPSTILSVKRFKAGSNGLRGPSLLLKVKGVPASAVAQAIFDQLGVSAFYGEPLSSGNVDFAEVVPLAADGSRREGGAHGYDQLIAKMRGVLHAVIVRVPAPPNRCSHDPDCGPWAWDDNREHWFVSTDGADIAPPAPPKAPPPPSGDTAPGGDSNGGGPAGGGDSGGGKAADPNAPKQGGGDATPPTDPPAPNGAEYIRLRSEAGGYTLSVANSSPERLMEAFAFLGISSNALQPYLTEDQHHFIGSPFAAGMLTIDHPLHSGRLSDIPDLLATTMLGAASSEQVVTAWPVTFVRAETPDPTATKTGSTVPAPTDPTATDKFMSTMAGAVQAMDYSAKVTVKPMGTRLLLRGPQNYVEQLRRLLAQWVDIPFAQVRLDFYIVQGASRLGSHRERETTQRYVKLVARAAEISRALQRYLDSAIREEVRTTDPRQFYDSLYSRQVLEPLGITDPVKVMQLAGFNPDPNRPLSTAEVVVFLALLDQDRLMDLLARATKAADNHLKILISNLQAQAQSEFKPGEQKELACLLEQYEAKLQLPPTKLFPRTASAYYTEHPEQRDEYRKLILQFLEYWGIALRYDDLLSGFSRDLDYGHLSYDAREYVGQPDPRYPQCRIGGAVTEDELDRLLRHDDLPARLTQTSAAADEALKNAVGAFSDDLDEICMQPLTKLAEGLSHSSPGNDKFGLQLVGQTRMVVTAGQAAAIGTTTQTTPPFHPSVDLSSLVDTGTKTAAAVAGSDGILKGAIRPGPALLLALGFGAPATTYNVLTPSVSIGVRPSVLKNGDAARLQLNFQVKIDSTTGSDKDHPYENLSMTKNQTVTSDVAVSAFDLFQMSSTDLQLSSPGGYAGGLGSLQYLPIIGQLFHGPTETRTVNYDTLLLARVTILPRSLDLAGTYLH